MTTKAPVVIVVFAILIIFLMEVLVVLWAEHGRLMR